MKLKTITVGYGQTVPGKKFESERYDMSATFAAETDEEKDIKNLDKNARRLERKIMEAVEKTSGRVLRRKKDR